LVTNPTARVSPSQATSTRYICPLSLLTISCRKEANAGNGTSAYFTLAICPALLQVVFSISFMQSYHSGRYYSIPVFQILQIINHGLYRLYHLGVRPVVHMV